jgi:hypothetical protein
MVLQDFIEKDFIQKFILIITAIIALTLKLRKSLSIKNKRTDLKEDIKIYEQLKKYNNFDCSDIENEIKENLDIVYNKKNRLDNSYTGFMTGLAIFIGFGLWAISIYNSYVKFNGWIILTLFFCAGGFSIMLMDTTVKTKAVPYFKIGFYNKSNMLIGFIFLCISGLTALIMLNKLDYFNSWYILLGIFFLIGLNTIIINIKRLK